MEKIFDNMNNYIIVVDIYKRIKYCNNKMLNKLNYKLEELLNRNIDKELLNNNILDDFKSIIDKDKIYEFISKEKEEVILEGKVFESNWNEEKAFFIILNDSNNAVLENNSKFENLNNELQYYISKYKEAREEVSLILEATTDLIAFISKDGTILKAAPEWERCLGWNEEDFKEIKWQELFHPDEVQEAISIAMACRGENNIGNNINRYRCKNGQYKLFHWKCIYIKEKEMYVGAGSDITVEERLEVERKKYEEAFHSECIKNEFLTNISHEFKTPLNITLSALQLINHGIANNYIKCDENFDINKYTNSIKQNSYRLLRLVNNLLDVSTIDMGHHNINLENYNIVYLIEDIVTSVANYVEGKNISITFDTEVEELIIACDKEKIERIVLNLISNAIKYTSKDKGKHGKIEVNLSKDIDYIRVSVKDNGIGIPEEQCDVIFNMFKRVDNNLNRQVEGSGIGLSLAKSLVELHGGEIFVESKVGQGTKFTFSIPIKTVNEENIVCIDIAAESQIKKCDVEFSDIYEF